jgi:hypothetical protein
MLNDARSPLQRIAEKCRHPSGSSEGQEEAEEEGEGEDGGESYGNRRRSSGEEKEEEEEHSEEADEGCRLLFARPALSSKCSRATLGQYVVFISPLIYTFKFSSPDLFLGFIL